MVKTGSNKKSLARYSPNRLIGAGSNPIPGLSPIGAWYFDTYTTPVNGAPYVLNASDTTLVSDNYVRAPRRHFDDTDYFISNGVSITAPTVVAADGTTSAQRFTRAAGGNWNLQLNTTSATPLPAGTYDMFIDAFWNGVGSTDFRMGLFNGTLVTKTATAGWQTFKMTFTKGAGNCNPIVESPDGTSQLDISLDNWQIRPTSSDVTQRALGSHIYFGKTIGATTPTFSSNTVDYSSGGRSMIQFASQQTFSAGTCFFVWSRIGTGYQKPYNPMLADAKVTPSQGYNNFMMGPSFGDAVGPRISGTNYCINNQNALLFDPIGGGFAVGIHSWDASSNSNYIGDVPLSGLTSAIPSVNFYDLNVGCLSDPYYAGSRIAAIVLFNTKLSPSNRNAVAAYLKSRYSADPQRFITFVGDSITFGSVGNPGYVGLFPDHASPVIRGINFGIGGQTIGGGITNSSQPDGVLPTNKGTRTFVLHCGWGANDLGSNNATAFTNSYSSYLTARRSAGYDKLVAQTVLPRTDQGDGGVQFNLDRASANTTLRGLVGTTLNAVSDFAADPTMGTDSASNNATLYDSKLHPTQTGHNDLEPIMRATLNGL